MGAVFDEFERELAVIRKACVDNPRQEMIQLFLLALEREELVSIGYRESLMQQRIAAMPIAEEVKDLFRHSLVWIWKDEEMHTSTFENHSPCRPLVAGFKRDGLTILRDT